MTRNTPEGIAVKLKMKTITIVIVLLAAMLFAACGGGAPQEAEPAPEPTPAPAPEPEPILEGEILIAVAASLQNAFEGDLIPLFNDEFPGVKVVGTYDGSGKLQVQIEEGLNAALFFSAATKQMNELVEGGFMDGATVVKLLENEVVLITGIDDETNVTGFENITDASHIAIGDPASVPAGQYAEEILTNLGSWDEVAARASLGTNVTEVLNWVAEGSAEIGIVYMTDAASMADKVRVIAAAPEGSLEQPVVYPVGLAMDLGDRAEAANTFLRFLKGSDAAKVFEKYGFKVL